MTTGLIEGLFGGAGTGAAVYAASKLGPVFTRWRAKRQVLREKDALGLALRVKALEDAKVVSDDGLRKVIVFIEGSPDPYRKNPDGTPLVTGGLLEFMERIGTQLATANAAHP
jgi:hypothetical protein